VPQLKQIMDQVGTGIDALGVLAVIVGVTVGTGRFVGAVIHGRQRNSPENPGREAAPPRQSPYTRYRQDIGRAILLGLEFLVAGDIIRTVIVAPTLENVLALGLIVIIRTVLSMALQVELEGRWPWQRRDTEAAR